jgi:hypothetical protein
MDQDFDDLLYDFMKGKPENIRLAWQVANRWNQILQDHFLKSFADALHKKISEELRPDTGWHTSSDWDKDRYSKFAGYIIWRDSWNGPKVTIEPQGTLMSDLRFGICRATKDAPDVPSLAHLRKEMSGQSNPYWELFLSANNTDSRFRNLTSVDGLIAIDNGTAVEYWAKTVIALAQAVDKALDASKNVIQP